MGTRADFYIRKDDKMEWLGSIAWDGYPEGISDEILKSDNEERYRNSVVDMLNKRDDSTLPNQGWPWPWEDSRTTDFSYIYENDKVMASCFGYKLFDPLVGMAEDREDDVKMNDYFPDMTDVKNVAHGSRSGCIVIGL